MQRHELANIVTQRGIALLSANDASVLAEALHCFETAIVLRRDLPLAENLWFRWGLSAGWMNRADVLTRLGGPSRLAEAVRSYDEALAHLEKMPVVDSPNVLGRHALAWMNRAITLRAQATPESLAAALISLEKSKALLEGAATPERPVDIITLATLDMNRAAILLDVSPPQMLEAMQAASEVLALIQPLESTEMLAAEVSLKARHIFCHAVAILLESPPVDTKHADNWIMQASERVEEAMALTARWAAGQGNAFQNLRLELFHYGCRIYLAYQPHFMAEFLLDVLDPQRGSSLLSHAEDLHEAGLEALAMAAEVLKRRGPLDFGLKGVDRLLEVINALNSAAERIKKLPRRQMAG